MAHDFFELLDRMIEELSSQELQNLAIAVGVPGEEFEYSMTFTLRGHAMPGMKTRPVEFDDNILTHTHLVEAA